MPTVDMMAAHADALARESSDHCAVAQWASLSGPASSDASASSSIAGELLRAPSSPTADPSAKQLHQQDAQLPQPQQICFLNILVAGQSNLGKTRFISSLAQTFGTEVPPLQRMSSTRSSDSQNTHHLNGSANQRTLSRTATLERNHLQLQTHLVPLALPGPLRAGRPGRLLHMMLQDTQGCGREANTALHLAKLMEHLLQQRERDYRTTTGGGGGRGGGGGEQSLPHSLSLCLYFLPPTEVSAVDLAFMSALSQEVPLLPVLVPEAEVDGEAGAAAVRGERLAALRRGLEAAMAGYHQNGKPAPIVTLEIDSGAVDALGLDPQQQQQEQQQGEGQQRGGAGSSVRVLVLGAAPAMGDAAAAAAAGGDGKLRSADAELLKQLLRRSVEPVLRSAAERFDDFCARYDMYGHDLKFLLSERMEPYIRTLKVAEAQDAAAVAAALQQRRQLLPEAERPVAVAEDEEAAEAVADGKAVVVAFSNPLSTAAVKRGRDSSDGGAADAEECNTRHAARPRAFDHGTLSASSSFCSTNSTATAAATAAVAATTTSVAAAAVVVPSPFSALAINTAAAASSIPSEGCSGGDRSSDSGSVAPTPSPTMASAADVERVVSAIEEIVTQLSRSLEASSQSSSRRASPLPSLAGSGLASPSVSSALPSASVVVASVVRRLFSAAVASAPSSSSSAAAAAAAASDEATAAAAEEVAGTMEEVYDEVVGALDGEVLEEAEVTEEVQEMFSAAEEPETRPPLSQPQQPQQQSQQQQHTAPAAPPTPSPSRAPAGQQAAAQPTATPQQQQLQRRSRSLLSAFLTTTPTLLPSAASSTSASAAAAGAATATTASSGRTAVGGMVQYLRSYWHTTATATTASSAATVNPDSTAATAAAAAAPTATVNAAGPNSSSGCGESKGVSAYPSSRSAAAVKAAAGLGMAGLAAGVCAVVVLRARRATA